MNVPKLRFKEFNDEWCLKKLSELYTFKNGINGNRTQFGKGIKFISVGDILNNNYITYDKIKGLIDIDEKTLCENSVEFGDVLFQRSSETRKEIGMSNVYLDNKLSTFGGFVIRGKRNKDNTNNPSFINYLLRSQTVRRDIVFRGAGAQHYNIGQEDLKKVSINLPSSAEQDKISKTLTLLDKKIELQTKKIEDLKLFKLCTAKIIFKDDSLLCKKQLKELCNIVKGKQINSEFLSETGEYYMLNGGINPSGFINEYNTDENTISISEGGNSCGYVNFNKSKFWAGGHCYTITPVDINNIYLYQILKYNENKIMDLRVGSGLPNIQKKDLENFSITVHRGNMQKKIATILSSIDKLIDLEEKKTSNIKKLKKGLMQNMFV